MKASQRIFLYGNTVILGTIGASLRRFSEYEVITLKLPEKKLQRFECGKFDVCIFDLQSTQPEELMPFIKINPTLLLIGLDPDVNEVQVWSGRQFRELSTQDLLELLNNHAERKA